MKPSTYIKNNCKTEKQQLSMAFKVLDEYLSHEEVESVQNSLKTAKMRENKGSKGVKKR